MKYAYFVVSLKDLKKMLREADATTKENQLRHQRLGHDPDISSTVFYAPLHTIKGRQQIGDFTLNNPERPNEN